MCGKQFASFCSNGSLQFTHLFNNEGKIVSCSNVSAREYVFLVAGNYLEVGLRVVEGHSYLYEVTPS